MSGLSVVLYEWPKSQLCAECKNGRFITSDKFVNSEYLCMKNHNKNDGTHCNEFKRKKENNGG